jgi:hypothetical protein
VEGTVEGYAGIVARMHDKRRNGHLGGQRADIRIAGGEHFGPRWHRAALRVVQPPGAAPAGTALSASP